jgi:predicted MFS family arabinose efflux permease
MGGSYFSWQFIVTLYLQDTLGWSPLRLALALLPVGLMVTASSVFSNKLVDRFGTARIIAVTMSVMAVGYLLFLRIDPTPSYAAAILPAVLLIGVGWIGFPAVNIQATSGIEDDEQGLAAGVLQTSMQVGAAVVLAVTTALIASAPTGTPSPAAMLDAYRPGLVFATVVSIAGALVAVLALVPRRGREVVVEPEEELDVAAAQPDLAA